MKREVLVAGIGNVFLGDDAFGVEVANRLATRSWPADVEVVEFGIRGLHLAYRLLDGYRTLILVDAVPMGEAPGTLAVLEPDLKERPVAPVDAHTMSPDVVLHTLAHLGGSLEKVYIVGCEPQDVGEGMRLSPPVEAAVDGAVELCTQLVSEVLQPAGKGSAQ